jgi:hypothetical protein
MNIYSAVTVAGVGWQSLWLNLCNQRVRHNIKVTKGVNYTNSGDYVKTNTLRRGLGQQAFRWVGRKCLLREVYHKWEANDKEPTLGDQYLYDLHFMKVGIEKANHQGHIKLLFKSWYK